MTPAAPRRSRVRAFSEADIPRVATLHRTVFGIGGVDEEAYRAFFSELYLSDFSAGGSLVCEDEDGVVSGFLGSMELPMRFGERRVAARVCSSFIVDPKRRGFTGVSLLQSFLNGPQDLSISDEANADARAIWEGLGGSTALPFSMHWIYPLRPLRLGAGLALRRRPKLAKAAGLAVAPLDRIAARLLGGSGEPAHTGMVEQELTLSTLDTLMRKPGRRPLLRPDPDSPGMAFRLGRAARFTGSGELQRVLLTTPRGGPAGWFVYYLKRGGLSEVVQFQAFGSHGGAVFAALAEHARSGGAAGLHGRCEPAMTEALARRRPLFHMGPHWTLIHSRNQELLDAFHRGDVFFSRLDGEWSLHLR